jgi:hypothetical protein
VSVTSPSEPVADNLFTTRSFRCVMIFFGALSGIGFSDTTTATSDGHHVNGQLSEERMVMLLEEKHREMKKLENEWAARRRTSKDVSSTFGGSSFTRALTQAICYRHRAHG